jgi:hypothetical protein
MAYRVILHRDTLGVTQPALQALRNELAHRIDHNICVIEVLAVVGTSPVGSEHNCETYGVFIIDKDASEIAVIGDGFRADNGGEGGRGHRAVQALLAIYGVTPEQAVREEEVRYADDEHEYKVVGDMMVEIAEEVGFYKLADRRPRYPDWIYHQR